VNNKIVSCFIIFLITCLNSGAEDLKRIVFKSDFHKNLELKNWYDVYKVLPQNKGKDCPDPKFCKVLTENNETFLKMYTMFGISSLLNSNETFLKMYTMFGISSLLNSPVKIDDSTVEIEFLVTLRRTEKGRLAQVGITSRKEPSGNNGSAFWDGRHDSGIVISGYDSNIQYSNFIAWQKDGNRVQMFVQKEPYNILADRDNWTTWRLVYSHIDKTLSFYKDTKDVKPAIVQHKVDMSDVVLNSVWLGGWGTEYLNIEVYVKQKK